MPCWAVKTTVTLLVVGSEGSAIEIPEIDCGTPAGILVCVLGTVTVKGPATVSGVLPEFVPCCVSVAVADKVSEPLKPLVGV